MLESSQLVALEANYGSLSPTTGERTNDFAGAVLGKHGMLHSDPKPAADWDKATTGWVPHAPEGRLTLRYSFTVRFIRFNTPVCWVFESREAEQQSLLVIWDFASIRRDSEELAERVGLCSAQVQKSQQQWKNRSIPF
jgi:hypothetical protein